jgi:serine phosphatase RsbU (regulator of sigma subunit)/ActR/RegA family two-component response regulator
VKSPIPWSEGETPPLDFVAPGNGSPRKDISPSPVGTRKRFRVLLIEDNDDDALLVKEYLGEVAVSFELARADRLSAGLASIAAGVVDVVLLDLSLPDSRGLDTLERVRAQAPTLPIVVLTCLEDREIGNRAVRCGAQDFLVKGQFESNLLGRSLRFAIERARRQWAEGKVKAYGYKLEMAREIQQGLLPVRDPELPGFDISGASVPAEAMGGDYFDYVSLPGGGLGIVVADATGHGFGPALMITETQAYLRAFGMTHRGTGEILTFTNRALAPSFQLSRFVTMFFARLDPGCSSFVYSSAGHPQCYVVAASGEVKASLRSNNLPLGLVPEQTFEQSAPVHLEPGDVVLLLTDGILDAKGRTDLRFGSEGALEVVRSVAKLPAREIIQRLLQAVQDFSSELPLSDDITALAIKAVAPV